MNDKYPWNQIKNVLANLLTKSIFQIEDKCCTHTGTSCPTCCIFTKNIFWTIHIILSNVAHQRNNSLGFGSSASPKRLSFFLLTCNNSVSTLYVLNHQNMITSASWPNTVWEIILSFIVFDIAMFIETTCLTLDSLLHVFLSTHDSKV